MLRCHHVLHFVPLLLALFDAQNLDVPSKFVYNDPSFDAFDFCAQTQASYSFTLKLDDFLNSLNLT